MTDTVTSDAEDFIEWCAQCRDCGEVHIYRASGDMHKAGSWADPKDHHAYRARVSDYARLRAALADYRNLPAPVTEPWPWCDNCKRAVRPRIDGQGVYWAHNHSPFGPLCNYRLSKGSTQAEVNGRHIALTVEELMRGIYAWPVQP